MALTIKLWCRFEFLSISGVPHEGGPKLDQPPITLTTSGNVVYDQVHEVAASGAEKLWDASDDGTPADFEFMYLFVDQAGELMFSNNANVTLWTHNTIANFPFILGTDASTFGATIATFGGTADDVEEIHWENGSSTTTANARLVLAT